MTTYTTIPNSDIDPESPITTTLMTLLRDNPIAIIEGASGAPRLQAAALDTGIVSEDAMGAAAISQAKLKTTTGAVSTGSSANLTLPGGTYGFYPQIYQVGGDSTAYIGDAFTNTSYETNIYLVVNTGSQAYAQQRYVQSSPPYDLGDGEIPLFIFVLLDNNKVDSVYVAPEAPWHHNGPTNIRASFYKDGKAYTKRKDMSGHPLTLAEARKSLVNYKLYQKAFLNAKTIDVEITQELKNKDMEVIPHPFVSKKPGQRVLLLDPVCDLTHELFGMLEHDQLNINELLHDGYIKLNNNKINRYTPPGVLPVKYNWK